MFQGGLILVLSLSLLFICGLQAQSDNLQPYEHPAEFSPKFPGGIDLVIGYQEDYLQSRRGDYMVSLDSLIILGPRDGEFEIDLIAVYEFDENHLRIKRDVYTYFVFLDEIVPANSVLTTYDDDGLVVADTSYFYTTDSDEPIPGSYRVLEYNEDGLWIATTRFNWNQQSETWELSSLFEREFEDELLVQSSAYSWDSSQEDFILDEYEVWEYEDGLNIEHSSYSGVGADSFRLENRFVREYNEDGLLSAQERYSRNLQDEFLPVERLEFEYDDNQVENLRVAYGPAMPIIDEIEWFLVYRIISHNNSFHEPDSSFSYDWDASQNEWIVTSRLRYFYDQYEQLTLRDSSSADPADPNLWIASSRYEVDYDYEFESGTYLSEPSEVDVSGHMILSRTSVFFNPSRLGSRIEFIYGDITVNTDALIEEIPIAVFPNPTSDVISVQLDEQTVSNTHAMVVDNLGRVLYRTSFNGSVDISTASWPSGIYTVVLQKPNGEILTSKQFVRK